MWGLCPAAAQPGISRPSLGVHRRSPVGATYDAFGSERYILTFDNSSFRDLASHAPYELVEIVANSRTYGGGGIFNLYGTVAADSLQGTIVEGTTAASSGAAAALSCSRSAGAVTSSA